MGDRSHFVFLAFISFLKRLPIYWLCDDIIIIIRVMIIFISKLKLNIIFI